MSIPPNQENGHRIPSLDGEPFLKTVRLPALPVSNGDTIVHRCEDAGVVMTAVERNTSVTNVRFDLFREATWFAGYVFNTPLYGPAATDVISAIQRKTPERFRVFGAELSNYYRTFARVEHSLDPMHTVLFSRDLLDSFPSFDEICSQPSLVDDFFAEDRIVRGRSQAMMARIHRTRGILVIGASDPGGPHPLRCIMVPTARDLREPNENHISYLQDLMSEVFELFRREGCDAAVSKVMERNGKALEVPATSAGRSYLRTHILDEAYQQHTSDLTRQAFTPTVDLVISPDLAVLSYFPPIPSDISLQLRFRPGGERKFFCAPQLQSLEMLRDTLLSGDESAKQEALSRLARHATFDRSLSFSLRQSFSELIIETQEFSCTRTSDIFGSFTEHVVNLPHISIQLPKASSIANCIGVIRGERKVIICLDEGYVRNNPALMSHLRISLLPDGETHVLLQNGIGGAASLTIPSSLPGAQEGLSLLCTVFAHQTTHGWVPIFEALRKISIEVGAATENPHGNPQSSGLPDPNDESGVEMLNAAARILSTIQANARFPGSVGICRPCGIGSCEFIVEILSSSVSTTVTLSDGRITGFETRFLDSPLGKETDNEHSSEYQIAGLIHDISIPLGSELADRCIAALSITLRGLEGIPCRPSRWPDIAKKILEHLAESIGYPLGTERPPLE